MSGKHQARPLLKQVIQQTNAHVGLALSPDGNSLYATGGRDDVVYVYARGTQSWSLSNTIPLNHAGVGLGIRVSPNASGLAVSKDGKTLVVANNYNDSISVIDVATGTVRYEHDLRPYISTNEGRNGGDGGTFPFGVVVRGDGTAYVSSDRNREVVAIDITVPLGQNGCSGQLFAAVHWAFLSVGRCPSAGGTSRISTRLRSTLSLRSTAQSIPRKSWLIGVGMCTWSVKGLPY